MASRFVVEHLNHLGIVAEVCREIGVAEWLDQQDPTKRQRVSVGTATVALVLNGLGFSNRRLYLVPQFFADKPVEHLLGAGIVAEDLNDDCLGRTLDWLYAHDVTRLFAGLALRARRAFGVEVGRLHADTTSFSVHGQYDPYAQDVPEALETPQMLKAAAQADEGEEGAPSVIEVTYGYSRDHREDLKQWMLALVTSGEGIPQFLQPLDGNASDKRVLLEAVQALTQQLRESGEPAGVYVADSGLYSAQNMKELSAAEVRWISRVPETSTAAQAMVQERLETSEMVDSWQRSADGTRHWWSREQLELPEVPERWIVVRTREGEERARATVQRQAEREQEAWEKRLWHLGNQTFACQPDAEAALAKTCQRLPPWFVVQSRVSSRPTYPTRGRPRKDAAASGRLVWQIQATLTRDPAALEREALRRAAYIVGTNLLDVEAWPDEAVIALYREQSVVERGFAFLKDPLFLASSVFVKKPERIMALAFVMTLCLLIYKLAEARVRQRLAETGQTVPDQARKPTARPTLRWLFQYFEGIDLLHIAQPDRSRVTEVLRLDKVHRLVLQLLGPAYENSYSALQETAE
ncbi:MAG TPA: IS1634 family transposase [Ktedonobacterales bacterium]|jgi:transposase